MKRRAPRWTVRLTAAAEADFESIVRWTGENFGVRQARTYALTLSFAMEALAAGPSVPGVKQRDDIGAGLYTLHVARARRRGRHFVLFRIGHGTSIEVLRLLHEAMDLPRHVPPAEGD